MENGLCPFQTMSLGWVSLKKPCLQLTALSHSSFHMRSSFGVDQSHCQPFNSPPASYVLSLWDHSADVSWNSHLVPARHLSAESLNTPDPL